MLTPESRFYLGINPKAAASDCWYLPRPMVKNKLGTIAKKMSVKAGFSARHVNHSGRKTCVSKLLNANVPPTDVMQLTGHKNVAPLNAYSSLSIGHVSLVT